MKGLCECGCGEITNVAKYTDKRDGTVKGKHKRFIKGHNLRGRFGEESNSWKGGLRKRLEYPVVFCPEHPKAKSNMVREHIIIAEKAYGGHLPSGVEVHHHGAATDNTKLVICQDHEYHFLLHMRTRALIESGDANKRKCKFCKKYDNVDNLFCKKRKRSWSVYHLECSAKYSRDLRLKHKGENNDRANRKTSAI